MSYFGKWNGNTAGSWWGRVVGAIVDYIVRARRRARR